MNIYNRSIVSKNRNKLSWKITKTDFTRDHGPLTQWMWLTGWQRLCPDLLHGFVECLECEDPEDVEAEDDLLGGYNVG